MVGGFVVFQSDEVVEIGVAVDFGEVAADYDLSGGQQSAAEGKAVERGRNESVVDRSVGKESDEAVVFVSSVCVGKVAADHRFPVGLGDEGEHDVVEGRGSEGVVEGSVGSDSYEVV